MCWIKAQLTAAASTLQGSPLGIPVVLGIPAARCPPMLGYHSAFERKCDHTWRNGDGTPSISNRNKARGPETVLKYRLKSIEKANTSLRSRRAVSMLISIWSAVSRAEHPGIAPCIPEGIWRRRNGELRKKPLLAGTGTCPTACPSSGHTKPCFCTDGTENRPHPSLVETGLTGLGAQPAECGAAPQLILHTLP